MTLASTLSAADTAVYRLTHPVRSAGVLLDVVTFRRPSPADRDAILQTVRDAELRAGRPLSVIERSTIMVSQLSDLPSDAVRLIHGADVRTLTMLAVDAFTKAGMA